MEKEFQMKDGKLHVNVTGEDKIFIPGVDGAQVEVGVYTQTTKQIIEADKIDVLKSFIKNEKDNAQKQIDELNKRYEPIKDLDHIDEKVVENAKKALSKGMKPFKAKLEALSQHIESLQQKKQIEHQLEHLTTAQKAVNEDYDKLLKAIK